MATTYVGRYPPLYYAIVGLPSLAWHTDVAVYLMRLLSGLLSALFLGLALALASVWSRSRMLVLGVAVTTTPMVILFGSEVNPSGLECAAAICVWTGGLILVLDRASRPPHSLVAATVLAATVMALTRALSPLWLVVIAAFMAALAPRSLPVLIRSRSVRVAVGVVTMAGIVAVAYILWAHSLSVFPAGAPVPLGTSLWGTAELALGRTGAFVGEFVGAFGWGETSPPLAVMDLWLLSASTVVILGLMTGLRRQTMVLGALVLAAVVLPAGLMVSQAHNHGVVWQARDGFPLYAGILLVAAAVAGRNGVLATDSGTGEAPTLRWATPRLALMLAISVAAVQLGNFVWALRRYTVGLGSTVNPFARVRGGWDPPVPSVFLVVVATVASAVYFWWIARLARYDRAARTSVDLLSD